MDRSKAQDRLQRLIDKARSQFFKPILVAETLRLHRMDGLAITDRRLFKGPAVKALKAVALELFGRPVDLNYGYIDGAYEDGKLNPEALQQLARANKSGEIERHIYAEMERRWGSYRDFTSKWERTAPAAFRVSEFIRDYEALVRLGNALGKLYEIVVYSLFRGVVEAAEGKIEFSLSEGKRDLLEALPDFCGIFFDLNPGEFSVTREATIYRAGRAHASDSGIDMWANFGPVIQVKHRAGFTAEHAARVVRTVRCDRLIIICKTQERRQVEEFAELLDAHGYVRILEEDRVVEWYDALFSPRFVGDAGARIHAILLRELDDEFPIPSRDRMQKFFEQRGYGPLPSK